MIDQKRTINAIGSRIASCYCQFVIKRDDRLPATKIDLAMVRSDITFIQSDLGLMKIALGDTEKDLKLVKECLGYLQLDVERYKSNAVILHKDTHGLKNDKTLYERMSETEVKIDHLLHALSAQNIDQRHATKKLKEEIFHQFGIITEDLRSDFRAFGEMLTDHATRIRTIEGHLGLRAA